MQKTQSFTAWLKQISLPIPASAEDVERGFQAWHQLSSPDTVPERLLASIFGNSPYLTRLSLLYPHMVEQFCTNGPDQIYTAFCTVNAKEAAQADSIPTLMRALRQQKGQIALLTALADITGAWKLERVTEVLSRFADDALQSSLRFLLKSAEKRKEVVLPNPDDPVRDCGIVILGMGKLGAFELNYSSDIDLIIFYEKGALKYIGRESEQRFFNRLSHDLVQIMQERTADGYVFRTDLRLRPDPASTPPAITTDAAIFYYESVGQNWERAAMIKARPVAGDIEAGNRFLAQITPFMWRRHLDFAAINDIHSIKRQMDTRVKRTIGILGHNIKLGAGGIREIEFYVQIYQLIWGGREPSLRIRGTCETLLKLVEHGLVPKEQQDALTEAYIFLRTLEHRLQMVDDQQTHSLPETEAGVHAIALFMGYADFEALEQALLNRLNTVHGIFTNAFQSAEKLGDEGTLVFTGVSHDPETLKTLAEMGFQEPATVSEIIMGWHHGNRRSTRTKRARELITELMPALLRALADTASPDAALLKFDQFLKDIPAGAQLFSLFTANPSLLRLIADIMGCAPVLAETLSRHPDLLDAVLYSSFYATLPRKPQLATELAERLTHIKELEFRLEMLRQFKNEKQFQGGVQLLKGMINAESCGHFLSDLADVLLMETLSIVTTEFEQAYGTIEGGRFCVIGLGRLGSREMTFGSDLDLVFVYDVPDFDALSSGEKGFSASVYYNRLAQRLVGALTALGKEGRLYEVDTRLRPSGKQGLLAVSQQAMTHYFSELAWSFEFMALTRGHAVAGDDAFMVEVNTFLDAIISAPHDAAKIRADAANIRLKVQKEYAATSPWELKYVRGGLMDVDFIAQVLWLEHARNLEPPRHGMSSAAIISALYMSEILKPDVAEPLFAACRFLGHLHGIMRLCSGRALDESTAETGLKQLLAQNMHLKDFETLKERLLSVEETVRTHYKLFIGNPT